MNHNIISPKDARLTYSGRIDFSDPSRPVFVFPSSSVAMGFTGTSVKVKVSNHHAYFDNYIGYVLDGIEGRLMLPSSSKEVELSIAENLFDGEHELYLFKRMDACHHFTFRGFSLDPGCGIDPDYLPDYKRSGRRMLFFGDSITAGEVSEAIDYMGQSDPVHNGEFSNARYSYAHMTADYFKAELHNIAQGGIALMDKTGWYDGPEYMGMESVYDTLRYSRVLGGRKVWDHHLYKPQVICVALGQNDANPEDYMKMDYYCEKSILWRTRYSAFISKLRQIYPDAVIILMTTLLNHHVNWDRSIDDVCKKLKDERILHCVFKRNGVGTPGHLRITEAKKMSEELCRFIENLDGDIW